MLQKPFSCPSSRVSLTYLNSSALLQKLQTTFLLPISKGGVLPIQTLVHDSKCCNYFLLPISKGGVKLKCMTPDVSNELSPTYLLKHKCITPNVANYFSPTHQQGGSLMNSNSSALLQMLETTFLLLISKVGVIPSQTIVHDSRCCKSLFPAHHQGVVLPT